MAGDENRERLRGAFGRALLKLRVRRHYSQAYLAREAAVSKALIENWEWRDDDFVPRRGPFEKVCRALNITMERFDHEVRLEQQGCKSMMRPVPYDVPAELLERFDEFCKRVPPEQATAAGMILVMLVPAHLRDTIIAGNEAAAREYFVAAESVAAPALRTALKHAEPTRPGKRSARRPKADARDK